MAASVKASYLMHLDVVEQTYPVPHTDEEEAKKRRQLFKVGLANHHKRVAKKRGEQPPPSEMGASCGALSEAERWTQLPASVLFAEAKRLGVQLEKRRVLTRDELVGLLLAAEAERKEKVTEDHT